MRMIDDMKKTIKKKKAFTLVELMGVLVIIGALTAILIPTISKVLKDNKEKVYQTQLQNIILSAKNLGSDNMFILPENEGETIYVTLGQLKQIGYADKSIINPKTNKEFSDCIVIGITKVNNSYEYVIDESTLNGENCNINLDSAVIISASSDRYIRNKETASFIVIVKSNNENNLFKNYSLDESKIFLGETGDSKYSVAGENGIYKITVIGGNEEGIITLTLKGGAILDEVGNSIFDEDIVAQTSITVDNTAPECGVWHGQSTEWANQNRTITMTGIDDMSGIKEGNSFSKTYTSGEIRTDNLSYTVEDNAGNTKVCETVANIYIDKTAPSCNWSGKDNNAWTTENVTFTLTGSDSGSGMDNEYSSKSWTYNSGTISTANLSYTIKDNVGNSTPCNKNVNIYVDNEAPSIPNVALVYNDNSSSYGQEWTNRDIKQIQTSSDNGVGGIYYEYSHDNKVWQSMPTNWLINWEGNWDFYVRACDSLGNCSSSAPKYWIGIDKTASTTSCYWEERPTDVNKIVLICTYNEQIRRKYAHCYDLGDKNNGTSTCRYKSLDNRFSGALWTSSYRMYEEYGFQIDMDSGNKIHIRIETKDQAGNASSAQTYTYTKP